MSFVSDPSADAVDKDVRGADLICELSLISLLYTNKPPIWHNSPSRFWSRFCTQTLKVQLFFDLKIYCIFAPVKSPMWRWQHNSFDPLQLIVPFPLLAPLFLLFAAIISPCRVTRFPKVKARTCCSPFDIFTSWTGEHFSWNATKTASCLSHLPLIKD